MNIKEKMIFDISEPTEKFEKHLEMKFNDRIIRFRNPKSN